MSAPSRRTFLLSAARLTALAFGGAAALAGARPASDGPLPGVLGRMPGEIGRRYLEAHPHEAGRRHLAAALGRALESRQTLRRRVRNDFRRGDVVAIDGWVLSRTEARLSALVWVLDR